MILKRKKNNKMSVELLLIRQHTQGLGEMFRSGPGYSKTARKIKVLVELVAEMEDELVAEMEEHRSFV